ncbi:uncharacterized protein LOC110982501 [Acanthaster planci]|uniref:Uncharacterized protein LOC110982501 n=1 Tax=Acanthaster planci TaxID=133434 RepID=A0A8B7YZL3_ACAPL|nr:uncharacterized protein LOC110982501 [Acanthaster planci]
MYKLCQSTGNAAGYCYNYKIYTGQRKGDLPATTQVVMDLKVNVVSTVMANKKGMPKDLQSFKLKRGKTAFQSVDLDIIGSLLAMVKRDKRNIHMLSTTADIRGSGKLDRTEEEKQKLTCVIEYNTLMGGR